MYGQTVIMSRAGRVSKTNVKLPSGNVNTGVNPPRRCPNEGRASYGEPVELGRRRVLVPEVDFFTRTSGRIATTILYWITSGRVPRWNFISRVFFSFVSPHRNWIWFSLPFSSGVRNRQSVLKFSTPKDTDKSIVTIKNKNPDIAKNITDGCRCFAIGLSDYFFLEKTVGDLEKLFE